MRFISTFLPLIFVLANTSLAQDFSGSEQLKFFFEELARSVGEGDFATYEALFHPDAIGVIVTSEAEKTTGVIAETLKQNKIQMAEVSSGKKTQQLEFRFASIFEDSSSALVSGMIHFWSREADSERVDWFGKFEMYLLKRSSWMIVANQQGESTLDEWNELD